MTQPLLQRLDQLARTFFPFLVTVGLMFVAAAPARSPEAAAIMPFLCLIAVYHFTIRFPRLLPYWATFVIGVLQDLISGGVVGVSAILLLLVQLAVRSQYRFFASAGFALGWGLFFLFCAGVFVGDWVLTSIGRGGLLDAMPALFRYLLTAALYPLFSYLLVKGENLWQDRED